MYKQAQQSSCSLICFDADTDADIDADSNGDADAVPPSLSRTQPVDWILIVFPDFWLKLQTKTTLF